MISSAVCALLLIDLYPLGTLTLTFVFLVLSIYVIVKLLAQKKLPKQPQNICRKQNVFKSI